jgi:(p)ppGpp synthase/HD superfamily hydrolase
MEIELQAREFAEHAHKGMFRWDGKTPYITHPDKVVQILKHWRVTDPDIIVSAYLHDVVEDTSVTLDVIKNKFGLDVESIVLELTFPPNIEDYHYHERCESLTKKASIIKLADIIANLTEFGGNGLSNNFIKKRLKAISILQKNI